jgi:hypothetical protein
VLLLRSQNPEIAQGTQDRSPQHKEANRERTLQGARDGIAFTRACAAENPVCEDVRTGMSKYGPLVDRAAAFGRGRSRASALAAAAGARAGRFSSGGAASRGTAGRAHPGPADAGSRPVSLRSTGAHDMADKSLQGKRVAFVEEFAEGRH